MAIEVNKVVYLSVVKSERDFKKANNRKILRKPKLYDESIIDIEVDRLRRELGLNKKKEERK